MVSDEQKLKSDKPSIDTFDLKAKRWFFCSFSAEGKIITLEADMPSIFINEIARASITWIDFITEGDFETETISAARQLGFSDSFLTPFMERKRIGYQDWDTELGLKLPSIQVRTGEVEKYPLFFFIKKNFILTTHPRNIDRRFTLLRRYAETILKKIPVTSSTEDKLTTLLTRIIEFNNERNFEHLRRIDERGDQLNQNMSDPNVPREKLGPQIYAMKHALITYLDALWDSLSVITTLQNGDAELITNDETLLKKIAIASDSVTRQIDLAEHMSDVLASGLEVMQTIYNNQLQGLNNRLALLMSYLTIIGTAVLVPNTLATVMSNPSFDLTPKDLWWYLLIMVGSTVAATVLVYIWVKKRGWLPKKVV
jgi:magnesium transporter